LETQLDQTLDVLVPESSRANHVDHRTLYATAPKARAMGPAAELTGRKKDGTRIPVEVALGPLEVDGRRYISASIRNVSELPRVKAALRRARHGDYLARMGRMALDTRDVDELYNQLLALCAEALQADSLAYFTLNSKNQTYKPVCHFGAPDLALPFYSSEIAGLVSHALAPFISNDLSADSRFKAKAMSGVALAGSMLMVPVLEFGRMVGYLSAASSRVGQFSLPDADFLTAIGNIMASAMQRFEAENQLAHAHRLDSLGQLTGGIAHDFNNLLTVVSGNLQILEDHPAVLGHADASVSVSDALRAAGRGAELVSKLLVFSRRQALHPQVIDMRRIMPSLKALLARTLEENIGVEAIIASEPLFCFADSSQLENAILNLALNARDAMPNGGRLTIEVTYVVVDTNDDSTHSRTRRLHAGEYICICVADSGTGMSDEALERAFEPFFTTKPSGKGTGLGLAMVYGFVTQSGGHATVESEPGVGSTVRLYLPFSRRRMSAPTSAKRFSPTGSETILVVEDEAEVRKIACAFLTSLGYLALEADSAQKALQLLAERPDVSLLFSDVVLAEGMHGPELAQQAKQLYPNLAVLFTSGYVHGNPVLESMEGSQAQVLQKPYRRAELAARIREALEQQT
jgi:signal transduction histidine kinase